MGTFTQRLNDDLLVKPRIEDLLRDKLVCMDGEKYLLTPKGNSFVTIITFYRKLINLPVKGG
jgi:predicted transcriptional regulator